MLREPQKEQPTTEPRQATKDKKRRFQIVKLEERIAPGGGNGKTGNRDQCNAGGTNHCK
jgi:hypothetical protein